MEQLALSERTLRSGVAAGGRHRPAGLHSPGLLEERYMHVEGPLDRIGTLSAFIWLVKTIDDAATTSSWTHACHVAGRRRMWPSRRAGRRRCRRWARGHPPPAGSHGRRRPRMSSPAGGRDHRRPRTDALRRPRRRRPTDRTNLCVLARKARYTLGHRHELRSHVQAHGPRPVLARPARADEPCIPWPASLFAAGRVQRRRRQATAAITPPRPAAAGSKQQQARVHAGRVAMSAGRPGRRTGSGHRSFSGTPSIDRAGRAP